MRASGAHDRAVAAEHDLDVGLRRVVDVGFALAQPAAHAFGQRDGFGLARIGDDAQPAPICQRRVAHCAKGSRAELCQAPPPSSAAQLLTDRAAA